MKLQRLGLFRVGLLLIAISLAPAAAQTARVLHRTSKPYQTWLDEDVRYIITDQERADFNKLTTDKQRDDFVEAFWDRRNPNPGSRENAFKEEHYRRMAYTNQHFAAGVPGWKTDRGRFYIMWGPPDSTDSHPMLSPPTEEWQWAHIDGVGKDVTLRFVDTCGCGEYHVVENDDLRKYMPK